MFASVKNSKEQQTVILILGSRKGDKTFCICLKILQMN